MNGKQLCYPIQGQRNCLPFFINIVTLSGEDSDGICQRYRHYPEHIPSLL